MTDDERDSREPEGDEALGGPGAGAERRRATDQVLLEGPLVVVEQRVQQPRPVAEATEDRPLADTGGVGDGLHGERFYAAALDDLPRGV